jgi:hypothetical protein
MESFICVTCGTQYPESARPPASCPICQDERQYVGEGGQRWTTLAEMRGAYRNKITEIEPDLVGIVTEPHFAIGQQARLIRTDHGNVLWEAITYLDDETVEAVSQHGRIAAIAISHPHFYSSMVEWSRALHAPIYLHAANEPYVMRPDPAVHFWDDDRVELLPGLTLVRCGGHYPGSSVLHWADGAGGRGALLTGDTIYVAQDRRWVSFMYSYPNLIPLNASGVNGIVAAVEPFAFDRLYASWPGKVVKRDAKAAVQRSAARYLAHIAD